MKLNCLPQTYVRPRCRICAVTYAVLTRTEVPRRRLAPNRAHCEPPRQEAKRVCTVNKRAKVYDRALLLARSKKKPLARKKSSLVSPDQSPMSSPQTHKMKKHMDHINYCMSVLWGTEIGVSISRGIPGRAGWLGTKVSGWTRSLPEPQGPKKGQELSVESGSRLWCASLAGTGQCCRGLNFPCALNRDVRPCRSELAYGGYNVVVAGVWSNSTLSSMYCILGLARDPKSRTCFPSKQHSGWT